MKSEKKIQQTVNKINTLIEITVEEDQKNNGNEKTIENKNNNTNVHFS